MKKGRQEKTTLTVIKGGETRAVDAFLSAVETLSKVNEDPEFYNLALKAIKN